MLVLSRWVPWFSLLPEKLGLLGAICYNHLCYGRVSEWLKETVLKTVVPATVPRVRIPPLPPMYIPRYNSHILGEVPKWLKGTLC